MTEATVDWQLIDRKDQRPKTKRVTIKVLVQAAPQS
jgi:hypothetical protein